MKKNIFVDGQAGTTGLQILSRLKAREDLNLIKINDKDRKNIEIKKSILNDADVVILCLPDIAAKESVSLVSNDAVKIIDASTAHRTDPNWVYGLPELNKNQRELIKNSKRVSNPGCYPTGFLLALTPLISLGILPKTHPVSVHAVSGFSGGGKKMIELYQKEYISSPNNKYASRPYALNMDHKHLPEMQKYSGLHSTPIFSPSVATFERGMLVTIPLHGKSINKQKLSESVTNQINDSVAEQLYNFLLDYYKDEKFIQVHPPSSTQNLQDGFLSPLACNGTNRVDLFVFGDNERIQIIARLDNLGKGASGATIQNLNVMIGVEEDRGL